MTPLFMQADLLLPVSKHCNNGKDVLTHINRLPAFAHLFASQTNPTAQQLAITAALHL